MSTELVSCPKCSRKNNNLRAKCIYCGEELPVNEDLKKDLSIKAAKLRERDPNAQLDPFSEMTLQFHQSLAGFNVIMLPVLEDGRVAASEAIGSLGFYTVTEAKQLLNLNRPVPIARYQTEAEAKIAEEQLRSTKLPAMVIKDEALQAETSNKRIKKLAVKPLSGTIISVNLDGFDEEINFPANEIILIVEGKIRFYQAEATEENKGFGRRAREVTEATEMLNEQTVVDIYTKSLDKSFRLRTENFDYSGLGTKMKLTALENFQVLQSVLQDVAKTAIYDSEFRQVSKLIQNVWPYTQKQQSWGLKGNRLLNAGKIATRFVHLKDNELQFNRYSRLRHYLISGEK